MANLRINCTPTNVWLPSWMKIAPGALHMTQGSSHASSSSTCDGMFGVASGVDTMGHMDAWRMDGGGVAGNGDMVAGGTYGSSTIGRSKSVPTRSQHLRHTCFAHEWLRTLLSNSVGKGLNYATG